MDKEVYGCGKEGGDNEETTDEAGENKGCVKMKLQFCFNHT